MFKVWCLKVDKKTTARRKKMLNIEGISDGRFLFSRRGGRKERVFSLSGSPGRYIIGTSEVVFFIGPILVEIWVFVKNYLLLLDFGLFWRVVRIGRLSLIMEHFLAGNTGKAVFDDQVDQHGNSHMVLLGFGSQLVSQVRRTPERHKRVLLHRESISHPFFTGKVYKVYLYKTP